MAMGTAKFLVTGGAGFFGGILERRLLDDGAEVVSVDLIPDAARHPALTSLQADIRDEAAMQSIFAAHRFDAVFHIAAMLAHGKMDRKLLWSSNVDGTGVIARCARQAGVRHLVFTSSNCLWASNLGHPVREDDPPAPERVFAGVTTWPPESEGRPRRKRRGLARICAVQMPKFAGKQPRFSRSSHGSRAEKNSEFEPGEV